MAQETTAFTQTPIDNLVAQNLNAFNYLEYLYTVNPKETPLMQLLAEFARRQSDKTIKTVDGKITSLKQKSDYVTAQSLSSTISNGNITITYDGPDMFLRDFVCMDKNNAQGIVISHSAGSVTLAPFATTTSFSSTTFATGDYCVQIKNSSDWYNSGGTEWNEVDSDIQTNWCEVQRQSLVLSAADWATYYADTVKGVKNSYEPSLQEHQLMVQLKRGLANSFIFGQPSSQKINGKLKNSNGGLKYLIANRGGSVIPLSSVMDYNNLELAVEMITNKMGTSPSRYVAIGGSSYILNIKKSLRQFGGFYGNDKVVPFNGLDMDGINTPFGYIRFVTLSNYGNASALPFTTTLANSTTGRKYAEEGFLFADEDTMDAFGNMVPPMCIYNWGTAQGIQLGYVNGLIDNNGNQNMANMKNENDSVTFSAIWKGGYDAGDTKAFVSFEVTK